MMDKNVSAEKLELLRMADRVREIGNKLPLSKDSSDADFEFASAFIDAEENLRQAAEAIKYEPTYQMFFVG